MGIDYEIQSLRRNESKKDWLLGLHHRVKSPSSNKPEVTNLFAVEDRLVSFS